MTLATGKGSARKWLAPLLCILIGAVILAACLVPLFWRLVIENARTEQTLLVLPIAKGETFHLRYTHSVNLSDVTDGVEWTGDTLMVRDTLFSAYGVGMPVLADGIGTKFENTPEGFYISGIDRPETEILLLLQEVPNNRLLLGEREIPLVALFGSGTLLRLTVQRVPLYTVLLHSD